MKHSVKVIAFAASLLVVSVLASGALGADEKRNRAPEGFTALFNGKDLSGWKGLVGNPQTRAGMSDDELAAEQKKADEVMRSHWTVVDGAIQYDGWGENTRLNLCTEKNYADFELYVDWKIQEKGDTGIYLRGAPQVQIWDPTLHNIGSGGLYNNEKNPSTPLVTADNPIGQWNTFFIRMVSDQLTIKLNGKLVVDNITMENFWEREKPIDSSGQIELQNHGNTMYFRNIYIRTLKH